MYDLQTQAKFAELRTKALQGTLSQEEMTAAVQLLTQGRESAARASTTARTSRAKAASPLPSGDDLLNEMMGGEGELP